MKEDSEKYQHKLRSDSPRQIVGCLACIIFARVAEGAGWLPYIPAVLLAFAVAYLIDYWIPPKPPVSFPIWIGKVIIFVGCLFLGIWLIPALLSKLIWPPLAYAVPAFLVFLSMYWIPPLYPVKRDDSFRKTLILSAVFAVIIALVGAYTSAMK